MLAGPGSFPIPLCSASGGTCSLGQINTRWRRSAGSELWGSQAKQGAGPRIWWTCGCLPVLLCRARAVLGALLYCFTFSILVFLLPGFSAAVERRKMPSYTWFNLSKDASAAKGRLCICAVAQVRGGTLPFPSAPTNTLQPPALTDLTKAKPAEKEGELFGAGLVSCSNSSLSK